MVMYTTDVHSTNPINCIGRNHYIINNKLSTVEMNKDKFLAES